MIHTINGNLMDFFSKITLVGLYVLLVGSILISGSGYGTQIYIWLLLPTLILSLLNLKNTMDTIKSPIFILLVCFVTWYAISSYWSDNPRAIEKYYKYASYIILFSLSIAVTKNREQTLKFPLYAAAITLVIVSLLSIYMNYNEFINYSFRHSERIASFDIPNVNEFTNTIIFGNYLGSICSLLLPFIVSSKSFKRKAAFILSFVFTSFFLLLTSSRGPIFSLIIVASFYLVIHHKKYSIIIFSIALAMLAIAISKSSSVLSLIYSGSNISDILNNLLGYRWTIWTDAMAMIAERPLIGYGADAIFNVHLQTIDFQVTHTHPHNGFILITYETGLIGLILFVVMMSLCLKVLFNNKYNSIAASGLCVLLFGLFTMITDVHKVVTNPHAYWIMLWLPVAISISLDRSKT